MLLMDIQVKLQTEEITYLEANKNQAMCLLNIFPTNIWKFGSKKKRTSDVFKAKEDHER